MSEASLALRVHCGSHDAPAHVETARAPLSIRLVSFHLNQVTLGNCTMTQDGAVDSLTSYRDII